MRDATPRLSGDRAVEPAHRFQQRFGALIRLHQQNGGTPQFRKHQWNQQRLRRIGQARQANFTAEPAQFFACFFDGRPAGDPREQLGNERQNHARSSRMRSIRRVVEKPGSSGMRAILQPRASSSAASRRAAGSELLLPPITITSGRRRIEEFARRCAFEFHDVIYRGERGQNFGALSGGSDGARRTVAGRSVSRRRPRANRGIALNRDYEDVAEGFGVFKEPDMTRVQQVETAARAHHSLSGAFPLAPAGNQLTLRYDLSQTSACRSAPERAAEELILSCARMGPLATREARGSRRYRSVTSAKRLGGHRDFRCYNFCQFQSGCVFADRIRVTTGSPPGP